MEIKRIISGGQTGADRAALDVAIRLGIPHGGWVPKGRRAEDGRIANRYHLKEMPSGHYWKRTQQNVLDAEGTLIISHGKLKGGSALTLKLARKHGRACLHVNLDQLSVAEGARQIRSWIKAQAITVLNVAGPRASEAPQIYREATATLVKALAETPERTNQENPLDG
ncbi:MAG: putative molybdenum carrier protein [Desulfobacteraceae bacterium]